MTVTSSRIAEHTPNHAEKRRRRENDGNQPTNKSPENHVLIHFQPPCA